MAKDQITPVRRKIILALADCNLNGSAAARKLHMDPSCITYHVKLIRAITGKDPRKFYDLIDLVKFVKGGSL